MQTWALLSAVIGMLLLVFPLEVEIFWKISSAHGVNRAFFLPLLGEIAPNFNLKYTIFTYKKNISLKKMSPNSPVLPRFFFPKSPDFYDKFQ
jgi:hypothetical protein